MSRPFAAAALVVVALVAAGAGAALSNPGGGRQEQPSVAANPPGSPTSAVPRASTPAPSSPAAPSRASAVPSARPSSARPVAPPSPTRATSRTERLENEVTTLVNQERARAGCGPVRTDERLRTASRAHSVDMATRNYFNHNSPDGSGPGDRARRAGYPQWSGENIAMGYRTATEVMRGWMNSPGHRDNILNCASKATGVGLAYNSRGTAYWTQLFGRV